MKTYLIETEDRKTIFEISMDVDTHTEARERLKKYIGYCKFLREGKLRWKENQF